LAEFEGLPRENLGKTKKSKKPPALIGRPHGPPGVLIESTAKRLYPKDPTQHSSWKDQWHY